MDDSALAEQATKITRAQRGHWSKQAAQVRASPAKPKSERRKRQTNEAARRAMAKRRAKFDALKQGPCADCGGTFHPFVMDLDHREGETKLFAVSIAFGMNLPWEKVLAERAKCDLVCANCHRMRTLRRKEAARLPLPAAPDPTRCRRGHARTPENTYAKPDGRRECRLCALEGERRRRAAQRRGDDADVSVIQARD